MKAALALLVGALLVAVSYADSCGPIYQCVKSYDHCKKVDECDIPKKLACGDDYCNYPEVCKVAEKTVCKDVPGYKEVCGTAEKVCKEVLTKCGDDKCKYDEECVKTKVCHLVVAPVASGKASASASASAVSTGGSARASASAVSTGGPSYGPVEICDDVLTCVPKDPCKVVIAPKCAHATLEEGKDYEGQTLQWDPVWKEGLKCGEGTCKPGYRCAFVKSKVCPTGEECGKKICNPGYECVTDVDCKKVPVIDKVCKKEKHPVCVLDDDWTKYYRPVCKTVWKCEDYIPCGPYHCDAGYACKVVKPNCPKKGGGDDDDDDDGSDDDGDD